MNSNSSAVKGAETDLTEAQIVTAINAARSDVARQFGISEMDVNETSNSFLRAFYRDARHAAAELVAASSVPPPEEFALVDRNSPELDALNQWTGDMMILQVLADSEHVNDQEREVLTRWMAESSVPVQPSNADLALSTADAPCGDAGRTAWSDVDLDRLWEEVQLAGPSIPHRTFARTLLAGVNPCAKEQP